MSGHHDGIEIPEADGEEQRRDALPEPPDPERTVSDPSPTGIEADPADVIDQAAEVRLDDDEERGHE